MVLDFVGLLDTTGVILGLANGLAFLFTAYASVTPAGLEKVVVLVLLVNSGFSFCPPNNLFATCCYFF
jgi:hypothetical protein